MRIATKVSNTITLGDTIEKFMDRKKADSLAKKTMDDYRRELNRFLKSSSNSMDVRVLEDEVIKYYHDARHRCRHGVRSGRLRGRADHEDLPELRVYRHSRFRRCYGDRERRHEEEGHDRRGRRVMRPRRIC